MFLIQNISSLETSLYFLPYLVEGETLDKRIMEWQILLWKGYANKGKKMDSQPLPSSGVPSEM